MDMWQHARTPRHTHTYGHCDTPIRHALGSAHTRHGTLGMAWHGTLRTARSSRHTARHCTPCLTRTVRSGTAPAQHGTLSTARHARPGTARHAQHGTARHAQHGSTARLGTLCTALCVRLIRSARRGAARILWQVYNNTCHTTQQRDVSKTLVCGGEEARGQAGAPLNTPKTPNKNKLTCDTHTQAHTST